MQKENFVAFRRDPHDAAAAAKEARIRLEALLAGILNGKRQRK